MSCCGPTGVRQIKIGGYAVGIAGYDQIMQEAEKYQNQGEEKIRQVLLEQTKVGNYVPPGSERDYEEAMWREFQSYVKKK